MTELARQSNLHIIVVEPAANRVQEVREQLVAAGLYGARIAVHAGDPATFSLPPYFASLMVSESLPDVGIELNAGFVSNAFRSLRPFGGVMCLCGFVPPGVLARLTEEAKLAGAELKTMRGMPCLYRQGPLPDSANWTHEHADAVQHARFEGQAGQGSAGRPLVRRPIA